MRTLIYNISELVTLRPLVDEGRYNRIGQNDLGIVKDAWLLVHDGKIVQTGCGRLPEMTDLELVDAKKGIVLPGLIDTHTHPVFVGSRSHEFCARLQGQTYQEIAEAGGGIKYSVKMTREASLSDLISEGKKNMRAMARFGTTTIEAKSGYGLSIESELKLLRAIKELKRQLPYRIYSTCLALHALPPEYSSAAIFIQAMTEELLPLVQKENLADAVDAFIETGYFSASDVIPWLEKAHELGLDIRLHADEFSDSHAAAVAARYKAKSADHLQCSSQDGLHKMAQEKVVATILPGTSLYTGIQFTDGRKIADAGCPVAIATDFNPGSSQFTNLPFIAAMAGVHCKLTPAEIIAGITIVAAKSLGLEKRVGALLEGFEADLLIHPLPSINHWLADMGQTQPAKVMIQGQWLEHWCL